MLWAYNIESVMAEKAETILSRGVFNTRLKDFYDLYILSTTQIYRSELFKEALNATAIHRGTVNQIKKCDQILSQISSNQEIKNMWTKYQKSFDYAKNISFSEIITTIKNLLT